MAAGLARLDRVSDAPAAAAQAPGPARTSATRRGRPRSPGSPPSPVARRGLVIPSRPAAGLRDG
ncbi:MAG: hypothetical protein MZV64_18200 [Ignavibacteriales bacterium]|nr:hypothetical protein [Ignavibacteriales bacterium]